MELREGRGARVLPARDGAQNGLHGLESRRATVSISTPQTPFLPPSKTTVGSQLVPEEACPGVLNPGGCLRYSNYRATFTSTWGPRPPLCQQGDSICPVPSIEKVHWPFKVSWVGLLFPDAPSTSQTSPPLPRGLCPGLLFPCPPVPSRQRRPAGTAEKPRRVGFPANREGV